MRKSYEIEAEHLIVTDGQVSAITTRREDGALEVEPFLGIVSIDPEDFEEGPDLEVVKGGQE